MTRNEHLEWAKERALKLLDAGEDQQAFSSMMSDLNKHEDLSKSTQLYFSIGLFALKSGSSDEMRKFIVGFN